MYTLPATGPSFFVHSLVVLAALVALGIQQLYKAAKHQLEAFAYHLHLRRSANYGEPV